jgi:hypothetical protein
VSSSLLMDPVFGHLKPADFNDRCLALSLTPLQLLNYVFPFGCCGILGNTPFFELAFVLCLAISSSIKSVADSKLGDIRFLEASQVHFGHHLSQRLIIIDVEFDYGTLEIVPFVMYSPVCHRSYFTDWRESCTIGTML